MFSIAAPVMSYGNVENPSRGFVATVEAGCEVGVVRAAPPRDGLPSVIDVQATLATVATTALRRKKFGRIM